MQVFFYPQSGKKRLSIRTAFLLWGTSFALVCIALLATLSFTFSIFSGIRAYVAGEGHYTRSQKDASYAIENYLSSHNPQDYADFKTALQVPIGDGIAREALNSSPVNVERARAGFLQGQNPAEDTDTMIAIYQYTKHISLFQTAVMHWQAADQNILLLVELGEKIKNSIDHGVISEKLKSQYLANLHKINRELETHERQFSSTLAYASRIITIWIFAAILGITVVILLTGIAVPWRAGSKLSQRIERLQMATKNVAAGDLNQYLVVHDADELGDVEQSFNIMVQRRFDADSALNTSNEFLTLLMNNSTNAIYALDMNGCFTLANQRTADISGYSIEELIGTEYQYLVPTDELPSLMTGFSATLAGQGPLIDYETTMIRKDQNLRNIRFSVAALSKNGVIFGAVGAAEDITEQKRYQTQLAQHSHDLQRSNEELERFAYVASHDLQEPLRTISGFSQLLQRRYSHVIDTQGQDYLGFIHDGVMRMQSLIDDLLSYAKITQRSTLRQEHSLEAPITAAIANLQAAIQESEASVIIEKSLPKLHFDLGQFIQVFQNLIGNSLKFRSSQKPIIRIDCTHQKDHWLISVADNGIGIKPGASQKIFELFQRAHSRDEFSGNGIGLSICKNIIAQHHGNIWVEDNAPGSVFYIKLPEKHHH